MADTGLKVPTGLVSAGTWTNFTVARVNTSDDLRATAVSTTYIAGTLNNFAFGLTGSPTIDGIAVVAEMSRSANTGYLRPSMSWNNGTNYCTPEAEQTTVSSTDAVFTFGGATSLWGRTWAASEFADGTFILKLEGRNSTAGQSVRVDLIRVVVYYTAAGGWANVVKINGVASSGISKISGVAVASISKVNGVAV
jgi:hypothetical protein